jgi:aminopeptidase N
MKKLKSANALELIEALDEFEKIEPPAIQSKMKTEIERITRLLQ